MGQRPSLRYETPTVFIRIKRMQIKHFEWACVELDPPINSRNLISCVRLDHALQWIQTQFVFGEFLAFSILEVSFLVDSSSYSKNESLTNGKVKHLWNTVFLRVDAHP